MVHNFLSVQVTKVNVNPKDPATLKVKDAILYLSVYGVRRSKYSTGAFLYRTGTVHKKHQHASYHKEQYDTVLDEPEAPGMHYS